MTNWKHYAGSILLAGLLLQGCGSSEETLAPEVVKDTTTNLEIFNASSQFISGASTEDQAQAENELTLKVAALDAQDSEMQAFVNKVMADNDFTRGEAYAAIAAAMADSTTYTAGPAGAPSRALSFDFILDPIKDGLVDLMDTSVGGAITSATFDVVLNSEGVTVVMLDMARDSETMTQIMIDALGRDWSLTEKMCPMLQTNQEFGEKFAALAEESDPMARFFFERVDAPMYGCLTDAMLLSNDDAVHHESVSHSTNAYMGILMERYATDFFIEPGTGTSGSSGYGRTDTFAGLMFTTGNAVTLDGNVTSGHGDANELINEQFFYSTFKTSGSTDSFVAAMQKLPDTDVTMFMDEIFLGQQDTAAFGAGEDKVQGYYNIISIAGGMYEGMNTYGFGSYSGAFIGFAGLIPMDRYMSYGSQFMGAGYFWAEQNGISIWGTVVDGAKDLYASYTTPTESTVAGAPARTAGLGVTGSAWTSDVIDVVLTAWDQLEIDLWPEDGFITYYNEQAMLAYSTIVGSPDSPDTTTITTIINDVTYVDEVRGIHGLLELAIREDMVNTGGVVDMAAAKVAFVLPAFSDITWTYAYTAATQGVTGYWTNVVDAEWLADLSTNDFVRNYFYPTADNLYIPSWLLAIDWLTVPANMGAGSYDALDVSFDGGYMDVYFVSTNPLLLDDMELETALAPIKDNIEFTKIDMSSDSVIAVNAAGQTLDGLNVYKIRVVTPTDVAAVLAALNGLTNTALNSIGINTDNATQTVAAQ